MKYLQRLSEDLESKRSRQDSAYLSEDGETDTEQLLAKADSNSITKRKGSINGTPALWIIQISILLMSVAFFVTELQARSRATTDQECAVQLSTYSPALENIEYEMRRFEGALERENEYKGQPSPEKDAAWDELVNLGSVKIQAKDMDLLRKPRSQVKIHEQDEDWYMAGVEVFHQLHCLNFIRQYTYYDYYSKLDTPPKSFRDSGKDLRQHVDHCIDMIRQVLQCNGDAGLYTHSWVETRNLPYPDFDSWHKCRKLDSLHDFIDTNGFPHWPQKSDAEVVLARPPCESTPSGEDCP